MRKTAFLIPGTLAAAALALMVPARADTMKNCAAAWDAMSAAAKARTTYKEFSATCLMRGSSSGGLTNTSVPAGATGQCKDGTYTTTKTHAGACSKHGGVAKWLT